MFLLISSKKRKERQRQKQKTYEEELEAHRELALMGIKVNYPIEPPMSPGGMSSIGTPTTLRSGQTGSLTAVDQPQIERARRTQLADEDVTNPATDHKAERDFSAAATAEDNYGGGSSQSSSVQQLNRQAALALVAADWNNYAGLAGSLQADEEIAFAAAAQDGNALHYAPAALIGNRTFMLRYPSIWIPPPRHYSYYVAPRNSPSSPIS
jgi:hypothetical protein